MMLLALLLTAPVTAAAGNVVTHWDEKAVSILQTGTVPPPPTSFRAAAILHVAMFDAVNSIEPRYKPYKVRLPATPDTSKEAAAAAAAGAVLVKLVPDAAADIQSRFHSGWRRRAYPRDRVRRTKVDRDLNKQSKGARYRRDTPLWCFRLRHTDRAARRRISPMPSVLDRKSLR